jgi:TolA-binding protein
VQLHLDQCPDCRAEIAGLRSVRNDLLAWEVPAHAPVWRPFVAAPVVPWWKQVPAWALAAAAGVVLLLGATGSVVAQAMMLGREVATTATNQSQTVTPVGTSVELSAAQARLVALEQQLSETGASIERISNRSVSVRAVEGDHNAMVSQLQDNFRAQLAIIKSLREDLDRFSTTAATKYADLDQRVTNLTALVNSQILK